MKQFLTTALAIVLFVGASQAQTTEGKGRHHGNRQEMAMNNLNLTEAQKANFKSLHEAQRKEMQDLKKNGNVTQEQRKALREKYKTQYEAILTPTQKEQWKNQRQEWKEKGGDKQGLANRKGKFGRQAAFFQKNMNLTPAQETKLKGIFQEYQSKAKEVRANSSLDKAEQKSQMKSLAKQYMEQGKAVLTPEQVQKLKDMKGQRKNKRSDNV